MSEDRDPVQKNLQQIWMFCPFEVPRSVGSAGILFYVIAVVQRYMVTSRKT